MDRTPRGGPVGRGGDSPLIRSLVDRGRMEQDRRFNGTLEGPASPPRMRSAVGPVHCIRTLTPFTADEPERSRPGPEVCGMEFRKILALRGPNVWANRPVLEVWVD